jgi:hypothetical protein
MRIEQVGFLTLVVGVTLISGICDSRGFVHAAAMWQEGRLVWSELGKSALGFGVGIGTYWLVVKYLGQFGVLSPETQTLVWFGITIVGVAAVSGRFLLWQAVDQAVAVAVLLGMGWLLYRTG